MQAVIQTGGKQYCVGVGDALRVEKLPGAVGEAVVFRPVLMLQDAQGLSTDLQGGEGVRGRILAHGRAHKVIVFKKKRRKNYRRTQGHRQAFTQVLITDILSNVPVK